jgi:TolA-binding protein
MLQLSPPSSHTLLALVLLRPALPVQQPPAPPPRATSSLNFATALLDERRYELAAEEFQRILAADPTPQIRADALYGLARAQLFLRQYSSARDTFQQFLDTAPNHPQADAARFRLAEATFLAGSHSAAEPLLLRFLEQAPNHIHAQPAWLYLGDIHSARADLPAARDAYNKALTLNPDGPLAHRARFQLARTLADLKETDRALDLFEQLARDATGDLAHRAQIQAGVVQLRAGRYEQALKTFSQLEAQQPANPPGELRIRRAEALAGLHRFEEAEALLRPLISATDLPADLSAQAAYSLGQIQFDRGQTDAALATWDAALQRPDSSLTPLLLFRSAEALASLGRNADARARFLQLVERTPTDPWADRALLHAARLALDAKDYPAALNLANSLIDRFPNSSLHADARLIAARAEQNRGNAEAAIRLYRTLLDQDHPSPFTRQTALYYLNQAYLDTGQNDRAAETLAQLSDTPLAANARFRLAQDHVQAGRYADAIPLLQAFLDQLPQSPLAPAALALLALSHHELSHDSDALSALRKLAQDWPDHDETTRAHIRLGEAALHANRLDQAIELLQVAANRPPSPLTARARSSLGWAFYNAARYTEAASAFASVPEADPKSDLAPEAALMHASALQQAGQTDQALTLYQSIPQSFPTSPAATAATLARARLLARSGQHHDAVDAFTTLLNQPNLAIPPDDLLRELAAAQLAADQTDQAAASLRQLLDQHPQSPHAAWARLELAEIAFRDQRLDDAASLLQPLTTDPPPPDSDPSLIAHALFRAARIALDRGQTESAISLLNRLIDSTSDANLRDQARFWRAEAHLLANNPRAAEPEFAALASSSSPLDTNSWRSTARLRHVQCLLELRRWADVLTEADSFLADHPPSPLAAELHLARGRALQSQALPRFDDARSAYQAAIDSSPGSETAARAQFLRGETFLHEKNLRAALREFHQVELLYPFPTWQAPALLQSGKTYEALGQPDQAIASYAKLIDSFPDSPFTPEARNRLNSLQTSQTP